MYGQTEATARMSYVPSDMLSSKLGSIGIAIPGGKFSLKIDNGESFDPGAEGEIVYRGANVMLGYATKKEDLSRGDELKGILVTGDLAKVDEDGYLYVTGRIKRFIKITGLRVNLDDVEKRLELLTKTEVACVGNDDNLSIHVVSRDECIKEKIIKEVFELYSIHRSNMTINLVSSIPKTVNYKKDYKLLD